MVLCCHAHWCFSSLHRVCTSCCALLYTFLSVSDSKGEFPRLLILLKSVLQRPELESVSFYCPSQPEENILKAYRFIQKNQANQFSDCFKKSSVSKTTDYLENDLLECIFPIFHLCFLFLYNFGFLTTTQ